MDVLADVLNTAKVESQVFGRSVLSAPWGFQVPPGPQASFHVVALGSCWIHVGGERPVQLFQGDVFLLPHGSGHSLTSSDSVEITPMSGIEVLDPLVSEGTCTLIPGPGPKTVLVCGVFRFRRWDTHPFLSQLPEFIHIPAEQNQVAAPLRAVLELLLSESRNPNLAGTMVVQRLADVMFVHILRTWIAQQGDGIQGWLPSLRDPQVGRSLALIHKEPGRDWNVEELATEAGMSRSAFSKRFTTLVGQSPMAYLTRWRMDLAARLLQDTEDTLFEVARRVGYTSEYAFNRAFKQTHGQPPGQFRRGEVRGKGIEDVG